MVTVSLEITRKEEIIQAAAKLFRNKGFHGTTMKDIAKEMGFKSASLYNHITSKDEILQEICMSVAEEYISNFEEIDGLPLNYTEKLKELIRKHVRMATLQVDFDAVTNEDWKHLKEPYLGSFLALRRRYENMIIQLIEQGVEAHEIRANDSKLTMLTIVGTPRWLHRWYREDRGYRMEHIEENTIKLLVKGLAPEPINT